MDAGATIGLDRFGMAHVVDDGARVRTVLALLAQGYADRIVLSHDSRLLQPGHAALLAPRARPRTGRHDHLSRRIVPELLERGADREGHRPDDDRQPTAAADARASRWPLDDPSPQYRVGLLGHGIGPSLSPALHEREAGLSA